jgi:hypothetical protein
MIDSKGKYQWKIWSVGRGIDTGNDSNDDDDDDDGEI